MDDFLVLISILRLFCNLQRNLDHGPREISDGDELSEGLLENALEVSLCCTSHASSRTDVDVHDGFEGVLISPLNFYGTVDG